jgi:polysaccharide pyruvyl transferase WcaK-like protein
MNRRTFLGAALASTLAPIQARAARPPRLLLRSSWQTVNIGDIAHTPGLLALLEKHLPDAEVRLWPGSVDNGVAEMLLARFPRLRILRGAEALQEAFSECDFLLHGSGPSLVAEKDLSRWSRETGKPYGVCGITFSATSSSATKPSPEGALERTVAVLSGARFVFFRDSVSLEFAKKLGCSSPLLEFGPDGAFSTDLRDDARAGAFLREHGLEEGRFLCCIARLRYTPYWKIKAASSFDPVKHARNEAMKEHDLAPLRKAIVAVVQQTNMKVLLCPEDATQMEVNKELLYDPLPDSVRERVVWRRDYWLTAEALSVYIRSAGLFGAEMHSPIMCVGNGIPAIVCRWAEQTSKGMMWSDIGLKDWLFDMDRPEDLERVVPAVLELARNPAASRLKAGKARDFVLSRQARMLQTVKDSLTV